MNSFELKSQIEPFRIAAESFDLESILRESQAIFESEAVFNLCHPFGEQVGATAYLETSLVPIKSALPDLERRDMIVMAGTTPEGQDWVGTMGNYMGTFKKPLLGIPPTGHLATMRYHEFFRLVDGKVVEMQAIWDLPELMMQAKAWPMTPQLGAYICTPAPMSGDGRAISGDGQAAQEHVLAMLDDLCKYPVNPDPDVMHLERYWHPQFNWYGPCGIGSMRGISGFRRWHQEPFLRAMPDRKLDESGNLMSHWFSEGSYVCETGWPNMRLTLSGDGWMGIAPGNQEITLCSLDFWRLENGLIRENWVLVDLLDMYRQIGVDVLARMSEIVSARV